MHVITRKRLHEFMERHPDSRSSLETWYRIFKNASYDSFLDVRQHFGSAGYVVGLVVFNISGNKYRLIAAIHYNRKKVYIRHVLTHREYDRGDWKEG